MTNHLLNRLLTLTLAACIHASLSVAQDVSLDVQRPVVVDGASFEYDGRKTALGAHAILVHTRVDVSLEKATPYVFDNFAEAMAHVEQLRDGEPVWVYLAPGVYWVDDPDKPEVAVGKDGREPFGMTVRYKRLHLVGLTGDARNVVLASQRGQTQGAIGNFTMFDFQGDSLWVSQLTMGNYCNVDLDYPLRPSLGRKKRSEAITQAHVGYVRGAFMSAQGVRFISRLNLSPLNGAARSEYENCHFECTDDALNGTAVYRHCNIDLYGQKPFWSTFGKGATFIDCDFNVKSNNREMYFCKQGGGLTLIRCRYHAPEGTYLGWTPYPQPWLRCYQQEFTMNGKPYIIGSRHRQNTVVIDEKAQLDGPQHLGISKHEATIVTSGPTLALQAGNAGDHIRWRVQPEGERFIRLSSNEGHATVVEATNDGGEPVEVCLVAQAADGREAACLLTVKPSTLPPPAFVGRPKIRISDGRAWMDYRLQLKGATDQSAIVWMADGRPIGVGNGLELTEGDVGRTLSARMQPRSSRSEAGEWTTIARGGGRVKTKQVLRKGRLDLDFSHFYCDWQPEVAPGCWTVDGFKPADTADFPWSFDRAKPMWEYGEGFNGAVGYGLLQAQRGARIMYTPLERAYGDMKLTLNVDPTKTAGQGFGSATGQYMDVCLKFDTQTLTGYGLRIIRTTKHAKAVDFVLVAYENGIVHPICEPVSATCYRTGCTISLSISGRSLSAHVQTSTPRPSESALPHEVSLSADVAPNAFGGVAIQHTGSCGESTTMLHRLQVEW